MEIPQTLEVMPDIARQIIDTFSDEWVTTKQVAEIVSQDPAISARLVGLANSAYFASPGEVTDVDHAITRVLGLDLTRGVAIGMSCKTQLGSIQCNGFDTSRFWSSALTISQAASSIQRHADRSEAALCGMLWNVGLLVAVAVDPKRCEQAFSHSDQPAFGCLQETFGESVYEMGSTLLQAWQLPERIFDTHHQLHLAQHSQQLPEQDNAAAIWLARLLGRENARDLLSAPDLQEQLEARCLVDNVAATDVPALREALSASM